MTLLHDDRPALEDGVRTMLHRLAADVGDRQPAWEDLLARNEAVVVPLGVPESITEAGGRRAGRARRPRLSLAAAAVLVLAVAGAVVVDRTGRERTEGPAAETISAVSPGDPAFDAEAAAAVWATGVDDPVAATVAYLGAMGVPTDAAPPAAVLSTTDGTTAVVDWSLPAAAGGAGGAGGTVYLRSAPVAGGLPTWTVVGAAAPDVVLADVRYDGAELSFTVARTSAEAGQLAVGVWIDGRPVSLGGDAVARAGGGNVSLGELLDLGTAADARDTLRLPAEPDDIVTLRVVQVVDGTIRSLTQMAMALPDADPAVAAGGTPSTGGRGEATGHADAATGGASGSAGAGAEAGAGTAGPDAADLLPGATVPAPPELPPLPLPPVPGAPAPTVPAPPATATGSAAHLP
jgi:hypothetical protein